MVEDVLARAEHATGRSWARWRGHLVSIPAGGVSASRRANAERWHCSASQVQKVFKRMEREGLGRLVEPKCSKLCRGPRHEHTSVFVAHRFAEPGAAARVVSMAVRNLRESPSAQYETNTDNCVGRAVLLQLRRLEVDERHSAPALARALARSGPGEIARGLARARYSGFLLGRRPGRARMTAAWALDHWEAIAAGRYDDRGRFGSPPPEMQVTMFRGRPLTPARIDEWRSTTVHSRRFAFARRRMAA